MESIDKLREWLDYKINRYDCDSNAILLNTGADPNALYDIADEVEREIAERYMLLPCDADGVPIHPGNRVELDGKGGEVWLVGTTDVMCNDGMSYRAVAVNHVKPRTIEDVLKDLLKDFTGRDMDYMGEVERANFAERADEIREMMGKGADQSNQRTCDACLGR